MMSIPKVSKGLASVLLLLNCSSLIASPPYYIWSLSQHRWVPSQTCVGEFHFFEFDRTEFGGALEMSGFHFDNGIDFEYSADQVSSSFDLADPQSLTITVTLSDGTELPCIPGLSVLNSSVNTVDWEEFPPGTVSTFLCYNVNYRAGRIAILGGMEYYNDTERLNFFQWCTMLVDYYAELFIG